MTSTRRSNSLSDVNKHPDDSMLLAYLRRQKCESHTSVSQHIENEKCPACFQKLNELQQVTNVLDALGTMRSHQYYAELTVEGTYARIKAIADQSISAKTANHHVTYPSRPRKSAIRLISVPFGVGLALLFTAVVVFASLYSRTLNPISSHGHISLHQNPLTVVINQHSVPKQHPNVTATSVVSQRATPEAKVPHIKVCSTKDNIAQTQLVICGYSFNSTHKVMLQFYVSGKQASWLRNIPVDKHGKFHVKLNITDCGNMPNYILGSEATGSTAIKVELHITSFGSCVAPTTPIVKPTWHSPRFGI